MEVGLQILPEAGLPAPGAGDAALPVGDDVHHLARQAWNIQHGAVDQVDPLHLAGRNAPEGGFRPVRLAGNALAVDQQIAARLPEAAQAVIIVLDGKAGNAADHIERRAGIVAGEICGREAGPRGDRRAGIRLGHGGGNGQAGRRQHGKNGQNSLADSHGGASSRH